MYENEIKAAQEKFGELIRKHRSLRRRRNRTCHYGAGTEGS